MVDLGPADVISMGTICSCNSLSWRLEMILLPYALDAKLPQFFVVTFTAFCVLLWLFGPIFRHFV